MNNNEIDSIAESKPIESKNTNFLDKDYKMQKER
jgi:hypothetical protein